MDRRAFSLRVAASLVALPLRCFGQVQSKVWRIGMLETTSPTLNAANLEAFHQRLRELGYVEGHNLIVEYRSSDGRSERFAGFAKELVASKVDLIVARGTPAALAAKNATDSIPVVISATGEPLLFASSLAHPGGNITGVSSRITDMGAELGLLREMSSGISRVGLVHNPDNPVDPRQWKDFQAAALALGMHAEPLDVRKREDLEIAFTAASRQHLDGLVVGIDGVFDANRQLIVDLATRHRMPAIYLSSRLVDAGGLMAYGPKYPELYREAATLVGKIFVGAKPGDLPIEQPSRFELVINARTAKALGLAIPSSLLLRADRIVQ